MKTEEEIVAEINTAVENGDIEGFIDKVLLISERDMDSLNAKSDGLIMGDAKKTTQCQIDILKVIKQLLQPLLIREILLNNVFWHARGVMRYNGVDKEATDKHFNQLKSCVHTVNDFDAGVEVDVD